MLFSTIDNIYQAMSREILEFSNLIDEQFDFEEDQYGFITFLSGLFNWKTKLLRWLVEMTMWG